MHSRPLVVMQELDWIFNGDDVEVALAIDAIQKRRYGRTLARGSWPGHEHNAIAQIGDVPKMRGQVQGFELRNCGRNDAHHHRATSALYEGIHAEASQTRKSIRNVAGSLFAQGVNRLL